MQCDLIQSITSKLLNLCALKQKNKYGNGSCIEKLGELKPKHPVVYNFIKKTKIGKWLEKRWRKLS